MADPAAVLKQLGLDDITITDPQPWREASNADEDRR